MDPNQRKEQFSNAFVQAIASTAGLTVAEPKPDVESVDWTLGRPDRASPRLHLQLKCSAIAEKRNGEIPYSLKLKNYNELRTEATMIPRILVLVLVPEEPDRWLELDEDATLLRHCAYWMSLAGYEESENEKSQTVYVPSEQKFTIEVAHELLDVVAEGGRP